jgi:hypothetical protein
LAYNPFKKPFGDAFSGSFVTTSLQYPLGRNSVLSDPFNVNGKRSDVAKEEEIQKQNALQAQQNAALEGSNDPTLDAQTRKEFADLYQQSVSNLGSLDGQNLTNVLDQARKGTGIYGIRRSNYLETQQAKNQPGRAQLMSLGTNRVLGAK